MAFVTPADSLHICRFIHFKYYYYDKFKKRFEQEAILRNLSNRTRNVVKLRNNGLYYCISVTLFVTLDYMLTIKNKIMKKQNNYSLGTSKFQ